MRLGKAGKYLGWNEAGSLLLELTANRVGESALLTNVWLQQISGSRSCKAAGATPPVGNFVRITPLG